MLARYISIAFAVCAPVLGQALTDSPIIPETSAEACSESLLRSESLAGGSEPTGISVLRSPGAGKRLFGVIPNYRADQAQESYKPLTSREKFQIARQDSFDWPNYLLLAGYAVQSQVASGGFSHNGGMTGFAQYYARSAADQVIGSYITEAFMPSLLHEDPRYFRLGVGSYKHRLYYAASRVAITRRDDGRSRFNISEFAGNASVIAITSFYYPASQSAPAAMERFGQQIGNDVISNLLTEFWPDVKRHLPFHRKDPMRLASIQ